MMRSSFIVLNIAALVTGYASNCNINKKGDYYCNQRVAAIRQISGFDESNPAKPLLGNLCTSSATDGGLFRWELCCKACKEFLGGGSEAMKEDSFVNTASGETCADKAMAAALCAKYAAMSFDKQKLYCAQATGRLYCPKTCKQCVTQQAQFTTAAPCDGNVKCANQTACNRYNQKQYQCTSDGTSAGVVNQGTCNCLSKCGNVGKQCKNDTSCGDHPYSCQATKGKCKCPSCTPNAVCLSDNDCGGYAGACGNIDASANYTYTSLDASSGNGTEIGRCLMCPGSTPCRRDTLKCTPATAVEDCGHAEYCVNPNAKIVEDSPKRESNLCRGSDTGCVCACATFDVTSEPWKPEEAKNAPVCIEGVWCGNAAAADIQVCGYRSACKDMMVMGKDCPDGTSASSGTCICNCTGIPTIGAPNVCLGASTDSNGVALPCPLANVEKAETILNDAQKNNICGFKQGETRVPPYLWKDVCAPDMTTGMCNCGVTLSPSYAPGLVVPRMTVACVTSKDCQSSSDRSAVCAGVAEDGYKLGIENALNLTICTEKDPKLGKCVCVPAHAKLIDGTINDKWKCAADTDCGWGSCMADETFTAPCTSTDLATSTCLCAPAGCAHGRKCGINYSKQTCGGIADVCEGTCACN